MLGMVLFLGEERKDVWSPGFKDIHLTSSLLMMLGFGLILNFLLFGASKISLAEFVQLFVSILNRVFSIFSTKIMWFRTSSDF